MRQRMQDSLYKTADAGLSMRQGMQGTLYETARCRTLSIGQRMQDPIRQGMQESLYETADAGLSL